jgi:hypothetical protein
LGTPERPVKRAAKSGHEDLELFGRLLAAGPRQGLEHGLSDGLRELQLHAGGRQVPVAQVAGLAALQVGILMRECAHDAAQVKEFAVVFDEAVDDLIEDGFVAQVVSYIRLPTSEECESVSA